MMRALPSWLTCHSTRSSCGVPALRAFLPQVAGYLHVEPYEGAMPMEANTYLIAKLVLWPAVLVAFVAASRWLPIQHPIRRFLEHHGFAKIAAYFTIAVLAIGGTWLTIVHS